MKKLFKRMAAALVATMLVLTTLGISMVAADVTVTVANSDLLKDHTFEAYQIFTGDQAEVSGTTTLSNIKWGSGIDAAGFVNALKTNTDTKSIFENAASGTEAGSADEAQAIAKALGDNAAIAEKVAAIAFRHIKNGSGTTVNSGTTALAAGYYLIVDTTDVAGQDKAQNAALLQLTDDIEIGVKTDKPDVEKKVVENETGKVTDHAGKFGNDYLDTDDNDTADYNIGDAVPFKLFSKIPDMSNYDGEYEYTFHDVMSKGLDFNSGTVSVYLMSGSQKIDLMTSGSNATTEKVELKNVTKQSFDLFISDLRKLAKAGQLLTVEFNATLNKDAEIGQAGSGNVNEVWLDYTNTPNGSGTGQTVHDKVIVFTYELDVTKIDGANSGTKLEGAKFVFFRGSKQNPEYVKVDDNNKVSGWTTNKSEAKEFETDEDGLFSIIGLDDGNYWVEETVAPTGYNKLIDPIEVEITADTSNGQNGEAKVGELVELNVTAAGKSGTANVASGTVAFNIANKKGSTLPETGGIGTTIFYTLGAILVIGGGVLLVTRKRMHA